VPYDSGNRSFIEGYMFTNPAVLYTLFDWRFEGMSRVFGDPVGQVIIAVVLLFVLFLLTVYAFTRPYT
jgi:hypothetical protein